MASLFLLREGFSHMSAVSGFDPLFQHLDRMIDEAESLHVDQTTLTQLHRSRLQRVIRKLSRQHNPITGFGNIFSTPQLAAAARSRDSDAFTTMARRACCQTCRSGCALPT